MRRRNHFDFCCHINDLNFLVCVSSDQNKTEVANKFRIEKLLLRRYEFRLRPFMNCSFLRSKHICLWSNQITLWIAFRFNFVWGRMNDYVLNNLFFFRVSITKWYKRKNIAFAVVFVLAVKTKSSNTFGFESFNLWALYFCKLNEYRRIINKINCSTTPLVRSSIIY